MAHIVLVGDSIFDNAPYVPAGTEVQVHLHACLGPGHRVSLLARDGDVVIGAVAQHRRGKDGWRRHTFILNDFHEEISLVT